MGVTTLYWLLVLSILLMVALGLAFASGIFLGRGRRTTLEADEDSSTTREVIPSFGRSLDRLERELDRVRRYDRSLAVLVMQARIGDPEGAFVFSEVDARISKRHLSRIMSLHVGSILLDCLRDSDVATWDVEKNRYVAFLPESSRLDAQQTMGRLNQLIPNRTGVDVVTGIAVFPKEGWTLDELVQHASTECDGNAIHYLATASAEGTEVDHHAESN